MAQVFPPWANTLARLALIGGGILLILLTAGATALYRSPLVTLVDVAIEQPIQFSHLRHVGGNGLDCRYCHTTVETSAFAGIPPTETCMTCHSQILLDAPMLEPVRRSWATGKPLQWVRVHDVPDFVYFNHSIHVRQGVGCSTCHGRVDEMPLTAKAQTLQMAWCINCHEAPQRFIRPREEVFNNNWTPPSNQLEQGLELVREYGVKVEQLTDCSVCHR